MIEFKQNCGYFFSSFIDLPENVSKLVPLLVLLFFNLVYFFLVPKSRLSIIGYLSIMLGSLGNLGEMLLFKCVTDYFSLWGLVHFNLFDVLINLGLVFILFDLYYRKGREDTRENRYDKA